VQYEEYFPSSDHALIWHFYYFFNTDVWINYLLYIAGKVYHNVEVLELLIERKQLIKISRDKHKEFQDYRDIY
jgi:hypothetical protein